MHRRTIANYCQTRYRHFTLETCIRTLITSHGPHTKRGVNRESQPYELTPSMLTKHADQSKAFPFYFIMKYIIRPPLLRNKQYTKLHIIKVSTAFFPDAATTAIDNATTKLEFPSTCPLRSQNLGSPWIPWSRISGMWLHDWVCLGISLDIRGEGNDKDRTHRRLICGRKPQGVCLTIWGRSCLL